MIMLASLSRPPRGLPSPALEEAAPRAADATCSGPSPAVCTCSHVHVRACAVLCARACAPPFAGVCGRGEAAKHMRTALILSHWLQCATLPCKSASSSSMIGGTPLNTATDSALSDLFIRSAQGTRRHRKRPIHVNRWPKPPGPTR